MQYTPTKLNVVQSQIKLPLWSKYLLGFLPLLFVFIQNTYKKFISVTNNCILIHHWSQLKPIPPQVNAVWVLSLCIHKEKLNFPLGLFLFSLIIRFYFFLLCFPKCLHWKSLFFLKNPLSGSRVPFLRSCINLDSAVGAHITHCPFWR